MTSKNLAVIVAVCKNNGIGANGDLPWRLKKEMAYFTRMTKSTVDSSKKNAVIMGRRTWDCIPAKFRPLGGRVNVVLSERLTEKPEGADYLFNSLPEAVEKLSQMSELDKLFVIGGARVYSDAMALDECTKIYLTRVDSEFECDAFFPELDGNKFTEVAEDGVLTDIQEESGLRYTFHVFKRTS